MMLLALLGCGSDIAVTKQSICDGVKQQGEDTVDQPFDVDGDAHYDAANPDCAATYAAQFLDCDDADPAIPADEETSCNGVDDDCNPDTPDGADVDGDGYDACEDCADSVAEVNPGAVEQACNDLDDDCDEATPDGDDADGDGALSCADCDDTDAAVAPGLTEVTCNGVDDDCDAATLDGDDLDGDGWTQCDDCDDTSASVHREATEICDNEIDDDCNGDVDDGCEPTYTDYDGTWTLDEAVSYSCAWGNVVIDFDRLLVTDDSPDISVDPLGSGIQPGEMTGTFSSSTEFEADDVLAGTCTETYTITGTFTSMTTFEGTFTADYSGGTWCLDCRAQTFDVTGSR
jgi:hypothetical protein